MAGAEYIVSLAFDKETAGVCNLYQVPYLPGCMTITEIRTALKAGVDIIKLFLGSSCNPSCINALKGPLPQVNIMPTGGINIENMHQWFECGCVAIGVGGDLLAPAQNGDYAKVSELAREYVDKLAEIRKGT
ncbi:2-dehydro-3-deoxyphosphogluconate aldolase/4-hydroxy-2-oxoglutarate aldolase [Bacillus cereus BAG6X1-2]|nr:2-dehydro-3-deoxyphosphogluconate aldolase/4-hydroxy-2-oxoglutarate aldolase [Bacillus cereus BAG6X1-2]